MPARDAFDALAGPLAALLRDGGGALADDRVFGAWALRAFRWQLDHNPAYRGYCEARGQAAPGRWDEVPPVPTAAFKRLRLLSVEAGREPQAVFRTSGTTRGAERRGEHPVADLSLYRAALLPAFQAALLPDGARFPLLSLIPPPADAPDSSLSFMMGTVADELAAPGGGWFAAAAGRPDHAGLLEAVRAAEADGRPVLLAATAFALVHWLDALARDGVRVRLPEGSRAMETGGFKGRSRAVPRDELYRALSERLGLPSGRVVNEYGMTELLSQFYEPVLRDAQLASRPLERRFHVPPPWVRTRVLDPETLEPVAPGSPGLLCHLDLANLGSVCAVLTEDLGEQVEGGFRLHGRAPGAEPRGCSLAVEELLAAAGR